MKPRGPIWRIGEGWDTHALVAGRKLILGGVEIPHTPRPARPFRCRRAVHAITDALLGAAALGDIGRHFPDTDAQFRGADSLALLAEAARARARPPAGRSATSTRPSIAQAPKMAPHIAAMRQRIAGALGVAVDQVNVKAKTAEKMGPVGRGERSRRARSACCCAIDGR